MQQNFSMKISSNIIHSFVMSLILSVNIFDKFNDNQNWNSTKQQIVWHVMQNIRQWVEMLARIRCDMHLKCILCYLNVLFRIHQIHFVFEYVFRIYPNFIVEHHFNIPTNCKRVTFLKIKKTKDIHSGK